MKKNTATDEFKFLPVPQLVFKNIIPAIAAMIMVLVYNLADTFFIGQMHDAILVAAVSLITPVFLLFMAVGLIFGIGGTSVISRAFGEHQGDFAKKVSSFCMWACVFIGIIMSAVFLIFTDQFLLLMGASPEISKPAGTYLTIIALSGPLVLISTCHSNIIRTEGKANKAMMGMLIGNLLNIILDPILILVFGWGIAGAAIATVIGNIFAAAYYIFYYMTGESILSIRFKDFSLKTEVWSGVLAIGIPASLGSMMMSFSQIIMNTLMTGYGDMALAGIGVAVKVTMIAAMVSIGLGQGVQPLLGYCTGAKLWERFRSILRFSMVIAFIVSFLLTGLCYIFAPQIVSAFLTDPQAYDYALSFSRILLTTSMLFGMFFVLINALQAVGAALPSLVINLSRQGLIYIPALFVLNASIGVTGLVWAQPVADVLSVILAFVLYYVIIKMKHAESNSATSSSKSILENEILSVQ